MEDFLKVITRFAPSPTGFLHLGGARTALFNFLLAKHLGGAFILRIDDTDLSRSQEKYLHNILESLKWLDISYEELIYQSKRRAIYHHYLDILLNHNAAYICTCTINTLQEKREIQIKNKQNILYDRHCAQLNHSLSAGSVVRIRLPQNGVVSWYDAIRGQITFDNCHLDDFIVMRSNGEFTYNFCSAIDDIVCNISHVIRGEDHISNTAKQIHIYHALKKALPLYGHLPLLISTDRQKLSKRAGELDILTFKSNGYLKEGLVNFLARLGWSHKDREVFESQDLIELFNLRSISKSPAQVDFNKLDWYNFQHLKHMTSSNILIRLNDFANAKQISIEYLTQHLYCLEILEVFKTRSKTLKSLLDNTLFLTHNCSTLSHLIDLTELFTLYIRNWNDSNMIKTDVRQYAQDRRIDFHDLASSIRYLITGTNSTPDISFLIKWIGQKTLLARINR